MCHFLNTFVLQSFCSATGSASKFFLATATIRGAIHLNGVRAYVYAEAQKNVALKPIDGESIFYNGDDLVIRLVFKDETQASLMQNVFESMNSGLVTPLRGRVVNFMQPIVPVDQAGARIWRHDYDGDASTSPANSLAQMAAASESSNGQSAVDVNDPLFKYQCLEKPSLFARIRPERVHLLSQARHSRMKSNRNNQLSASRSFHEYLDGLNADHPWIVLSPGETLEEREVEVGQKRTVVEVLIDCLDDGTADFIHSRLKEGSRREAKLVKPVWWHSPLVRLVTSVAVEDPVTFVQCLEGKRDETLQVWRSTPGLVANL